MWKNTTEYGKYPISLHDCRATGLTVQGDELVFTFADGFWVYDEDNEGGMIKTETAEVRIVGAADGEVHLFRELRLFRRRICTTRITVPLETLAANLNSGRWELEFLYEYHGGVGVIYQGWLWMKRRPYHRECNLSMGYKKIEYRWNDLQEGRSW